MATPSSTVSRVVWPRGGRPADPGPDLRRAALVQAGALALVGALVRFGLGHGVMAYVLWTLAIAALVTGLLRPAAFAPIERFGRVLAQVVGAALTWLLLAPCYVVGFGLAAMVLRLRGEDPMQRRYLPAGLSYWVARRRRAGAGDYTRQFRVEDLGARKERRPLETGAPEDGS